MRQDTHVRARVRRLAAPAVAADGQTPTATTSQQAHTARYHKHLVRKDHKLAKRKAYLHSQRLKHDRVTIISRWSNFKLVHDIHKLRRQTLGPRASRGSARSCAGSRVASRTTTRAP